MTMCGAEGKAMWWTLRVDGIGPLLLCRNGAPAMDISGERLADSFGHAVGGEVVTAVVAEEIGGARASIAVAAGSRDLAGALRAEVKVALDAAAACGATGNQRLTQEEVKD